MIRISFNRVGWQIASEIDFLTDNGKLVLMITYQV